MRTNKFEDLTDKEITDIAKSDKILSFATIEEKGKTLAIGKPPLKIELMIIKKMIKLKKSQTEIANVLGVKQAHISKRLNLFKLIPELFKRVLDGTLAVSTARELAALPKEEQSKVRDITHKEACDLKKRFVGKNNKERDSGGV